MFKQLFAFNNKNMLKMLIMQSLTRYADAHKIPIEFCGDFNKYGDNEDDE